MTDFSDLNKSKIKYIKLGHGGAWEKECIDHGIIRLGFHSDREEIRRAAEIGDWKEIKAYWKQRAEEQGSKGTPSHHANQTRAFFEDDGSVLWITFSGGYLYYGQSEGGEWTPHEDGHGSYRRMASGWKNVDRVGRFLEIGGLSGLLTKTAAFRQTICGFDDRATDYLKRRLDAKTRPQVEDALAARNALVERVKDVLSLFTWKDFETLVELIFAQSGWRRTRTTGGSQRTLDLDLENPITKSKVWVQVKSKSRQAEFEDYLTRHAEEMPEYDLMYYVYHTGSISYKGEDAVLWGSDTVAEQVVRNGLIDWVIERAG